MDAVGQVQRGIARHAFEQEGDQGCVEVGGEGRIDGFEARDIGGTEVGGGAHASDDETHLGVGIPGAAEDGVEVLAQGVDVEAAEHFVAAQLEDEHGDGQAEQPIEAAQTARRGVAAHARIDDAVVEARGSDALLDQSRIGLVGGQPVAGRETGSQEDDDGAFWRAARPAARGGLRRSGARRVGVLAAAAGGERDPQ